MVVLPRRECTATPVIWLSMRPVGSLPTCLCLAQVTDRRGCRIGYYRQGDVADVTRHDDFVAWFFDAGEKWRRALAEVIPLLHPSLPKLIHT